jgi:hypothetical protein
MRCMFCRTDLETVHWAFDGVSDQPVPTCKACCDRLRVLIDNRTRNGVDQFDGELILLDSPEFPDWPAVIKYMRDADRR